MDWARFQETPLVVGLRLLGDLLLLNILAILCSLPVVTAGASLSAMYAVCLIREQNGGEVSTIKTFFRYFLKNFLQATILTVIIAVIALICAGDIWFALNAQPPIRSLYLVIGTILALITVLQVILGFAQQSIYQNSIGGYIKNSFFLALCAPGRLLLAIVAWALPWVLLVRFPDVFLVRLGFLYLMWAFSFPVWVSAKLFLPVFEKAGKKPDQPSSESDLD